jgi:hypothetical protein
MEKVLRIGNNLLIIPKNEWEGEIDINSFMEKIEMSPSQYFNVRRYVMNTFMNLGIIKNVAKEYANEVITGIEVTIEGKYRGIHTSIEDPDEISKFLSGELAISIDSDGGEHYVGKEIGFLQDWSPIKSNYFYFKKEK